MRSTDEVSSDKVSSTFAQLIDPIAVTEFFQKYWDQRPLHVAKSKPAGFESLLAVGDIERILCEADRNHIQFSVVNADKEIKRSDYIVDDRNVDVVRLFQLVGEGATLVLNHVHMRHPPLGEFCRALEGVLSMPVQCNVYLTAPGGQGFKPHFDTHDVFILQAAGSKAWRTYAPSIERPMRGQSFRLDRDVMGEPAGDFELAAGDVAYIPRGWGHEGRASNDLALHLTVGVLSYTWAELLIEAVSAACTRNAEFRRALPVGFARPEFDVDGAKSQFAEYWRELDGAIDFDAAFGHFLDRVVDHAPIELQGQLRQLTRLADLTLQSVAGPRRGTIYTIREADQKVSLRFHGRSIELPAAAGPAVRFALSTPEFLIDDIPDTLDKEGKLVLVRRLILEGLLETRAGQ